MKFHGYIHDKILTRINIILNLKIAVKLEKGNICALVDH